MKKTVFLLFLLLPFCYLLAQPSIPVNHPFTSIAQPVDDHNLVQNGVNDGDDNYWIDVQTGNDNYLWLDIQGNKNGLDEASESFQKGNRNYADVLQPGNRNRFDITQKNMIGSGTNNRNKTYINQVGNRNEAIVNQKIKAITGDPGTEGKLVAKTLQKGDRNTSIQEQKGMKNRALVVQRGDRGVAEQYQGGSNNIDPGKAYYNSAMIKQRNGAVRAKAYQYQHGFNNDALVLQSSDRSKAYQVQFNDAGAKDNNWNDNIARIKQRDDGTGLAEGNRAFQVQSYNALVDDVGNMATINQKGSNNRAWQVQLGGKNVATTNQIGDNNHGKVLQLQTGHTGLPVGVGDLPFTLPGSISSKL